MDRFTAALNAVCPYYTMFPLAFPLGVLSRRSQPKQWVLDPFCGRGTTTFGARLLGRLCLARTPSAPSAFDFRNRSPTPYERAEDDLFVDGASHGAGLSRASGIGPRKHRAQAATADLATRRHTSASPDA